jgi:hypothetical protein
MEEQGIVYDEDAAELPMDPVCWLGSLNVCNRQS